MYKLIILFIFIRTNTIKGVKKIFAINYFYNNVEQQILIDFFFFNPKLQFF